MDQKNFPYFLASVMSVLILVTHRNHQVDHIDYLDVKNLTFVAIASNDQIYGEKASMDRLSVVDYGFDFLAGDAPEVIQVDNIVVEGSHLGNE